MASSSCFSASKPWGSEADSSYFMALVGREGEADYPFGSLTKSWTNGGYLPGATRLRRVRVCTACTLPRRRLSTYFACKSLALSRSHVGHFFATSRIWYSGESNPLRHHQLGRSASERYLMSVHAWHR